MVELDGGTPTKFSAWPAAKDAHAWDSAKGRELAGVNSAHVEIIEKYQPKEAGDEAELHPFTALVALSNQDKHHVITPVPMSLQDMAVGPVVGHRCQIIREERLFGYDRPLVPGTELERIFLSDIQPGHEVQMERTFRLSQRWKMDARSGWFWS